MKIRNPDIQPEFASEIFIEIVWTNAREYFARHGAFLERERTVAISKGEATSEEVLLATYAADENGKIRMKFDMRISPDEIKREKRLPRKFLEVHVWWGILQRGALEMERTGRINEEELDSILEAIELRDASMLAQPLKEYCFLQGIKDEVPF